MKKINQEEYEMLKSLDDKWKWVARDEDESLFAYSEKTPKDNYSRDWGFTGDEWLLIKKNLFQFIQWENSEPYNIAELIEEYESEETKVKKQELIKNIKSLARERSQQWPHEEMVELSDVLELINQLDEPEVLSQELPVVPRFVAEWIEKVKEYDADILTAIIDGHYNIEVSEWLFINVEQVNVVNIEKLMRAWLDGYTVEEKKYYILLPKIKRNWRYVSLRGNYDEFIDHYTDSVEDLQAFTEKEIKAVEPRYFAFAVPVEELEK